MKMRQTIMKGLVLVFWGILCFFAIGMKVEAKGVIISEYALDSQMAVAGQANRLVLTVQNTGDVTVNDVILTVNSSDELYPVYGESNQIYIKRISANASVEVEYYFEISGADEEIINVPISILYTDKEGLETGSNVATIAVPVGKACDFTIIGVDMEGSTKKGSKTLVGVKYVNSGETEIYDVSLHFEGEIAEEVKENQVGDLLPGSQKYDDYYIVFNEVGENELIVFFTYKDALGNEYVSDRQSLFIQVLEKTEIVKEPEVPGKDISVADSQKKVVLLCSIAIVIILGIVYITRRRK